MITVSVIGASGYSGAELLRLLSTHTGVSINHVFGAASAGKRLDEVYPWFSKQVEHTLETFDHASLSGTDIAFVALPSGEAMNIVPRALQTVNRVIDLSGDFRLSSATMYKQFYNHEHVASDLLAKAVYGLPEVNKNTIENAVLIANPGCYPTSAILALLPALHHKLIQPDGIVITSLSGVSGAGRASSFELSFAEINENIRAYKIARHQHIPEIQLMLSTATGQEVGISFVPHLVPVTRGIYTTIHSNMNCAITQEAVRELYREFYKNAPFVRLRNGIPQLKDVTYTNFCDINVTIEPRTNQLIIVSVIDNLIKGAAGQAIQNMNIMFGLDQTTGLLQGKKNIYVH